MRKGIEFTMDVETITDFDEFNSHQDLIDELKEFISKVDYGAEIGFNDRDILMFHGNIMSFTKKECEAKYTLLKSEYARILSKYYGKVKVIDRMKLYFTHL